MCVNAFFFQCLASLLVPCVSIIFIYCVFVLLLLRRWFICYGKADNRVSRGLNKWHLIDRKSPKFPHTLRIHISRKFSSKRWKQFKHNNNNQNVKWMREKKCSHRNENKWWWMNVGQKHRWKSMLSLAIVLVWEYWRVEKNPWNSL